MNWQEIETFLAVAEELHFGCHDVPRRAARVHSGAA
ncbi:hypothetical protein DFR75_11142 [Nocardia ignorata]|uniref:Uncharacterized protein n=1 Tax=Nocardia ignorata TaxID=145285 RepID=A0A4R6NZ11_NOCIG|nr:hypothetical protein DFR75_11142 [Nocardia ignorata]